MTTSAPSQPFVFSPGAASAPAVADGPQRLVDETRREIAELIREVAVAVRSERTPAAFFELLIDRIHRAMAAEGVVVWDTSDPPPEFQARRQPTSLPAPQSIATASASPATGNQLGDRGAEAQAARPLHRLGRLTDQSIPPGSEAAHQRLLAEVVAGGQPVVVPPTPGETNPESPLNPTDVPVALVPIELDPSVAGSAYLLEVFLEPGCGVTTQRGYLRFVAQMADLAGEFLRHDQLRRLRHRQQLTAAIDDALVELHQLTRRRDLETTIVDQVADLFGFDRVGWLTGDPPRLIAVSHVESIDRHSEAGRRLQSAAAATTVSQWYDDPPTDVEGLVVRAVIAVRSPQIRRLVCMQSSDRDPIDRRDGESLSRYLEHALRALDHLAHLEAIPGGRWLTAFAARDVSSRGQRRRKLISAAALVGTVTLAMLIPIPLVVSSPATLAASRVQMVSAPRDAIVAQIHVTHGQRVAPGDLLVSLEDADLDAQISALVGRRAVLLQQQAHWKEVLVDTASHQLDRLEQVQGETRLVRQEIQAVDNQLTVLRQATESLQIRALQGGTIDAWQIEQRLPSRPLRRGDPVLQVIAEDSPWLVQARVPPSRISHLHEAMHEQTLDARVALEAEPERTWTATLERIGPTIQTHAQAEPALSVLLTLDRDAARGVTATQRTRDQNGAPARVLFHCGRAPAGFVLFQDLIRNARTTAALYFGGDSAS